jgi:hypothetical protein
MSPNPSLPERPGSWVPGGDSATQLTAPPIGQTSTRILHGIYFFSEIFGREFCSESRLTSCSVFRQTACMEAEIDCSLQSNSS